MSTDGRPSTWGSWPKRHPCDVTAERLLGHVEKYHDKMDGAERDALSLVRFVLQEIAEGNR